MKRLICLFRGHHYEPETLYLIGGPVPVERCRCCKRMRAVLGVQVVQWEGE